jgi:outer membrane protein OmpA-like peptidoglycan-associated protein
MKCALVFLILAAIAPVSAEEVHRPPLNLEFRKLDLEFRVQNLATKAQDLQAESQDLKMKETDTEIRFELSGDVLFDFNQSNIRAAAEPSLEKVAAAIQEYPKAEVSIEGHTDSKGSDGYNQNLSLKRAESVKLWLIARGVNGANLSTRGWGETKPVAPNQNADGSDNPEGRQQNRRVEIVVKKS